MSPFLSRSFVHTGLVCLLAMLPLSAQQGRLKLDQLNALSGKASDVVDVTLDGAALSMASKFMEKEPEAKALVAGLKGIYVKVFEFDKPGIYTPADVESIRAQLQTPGWTRIVQVKSKKSGDVEVYVLEDGKGGNSGMAVFVAEAKELVVVNIVGSIDIEKLSSLEGKMGIPKVGLGKGHKKEGAK